MSDIKNNFKIIFDEPEMTDNKTASLNEIEKLHNHRITVYEQYLHTPQFREEIGRVAGKISGEVRSHRTTLMLTILIDIHEKSPSSFTDFTLTTWRELALALFGIAPAKSELLVLIDDDYRNTSKRFRFNQNGWHPQAAMQNLLQDHEGVVDEIRTYHNKHIVDFYTAAQKLKKAADKKIAKIKKAAA